MDDDSQPSGLSISRRGLLRTATGVVVAGALLDAAGSLGAAAAPASGQSGQLTLFDAGGNQVSTITLYSWSWGASNPSSAGGMGSGKSTPQLTITKEIDESSALLLQQEAGQPTVARALLTFTSADGQACSLDMTQIQGFSNELSFAVNEVGSSKPVRHHTCVFDGIIIVIKIGNLTITIKF